MLLLPVVGAALLAVLAWDVFFTVFHSQGRGGPLNRRLSRGIWSLVRGAGGRRGAAPREGVLTLGGPLIVVVTLALWMLLLVVAFALVYYPWIGGFLLSPGELRAPWLEALYYSAYTAATLGLGDLIADSPALRIVTVLEAFGGFALLSVSVTYFLAVYREVIAMRSLAADVSGLCRRGEEQVIDYAREEGREALARWCEHLSSALSRVLLAHFQYPVLHYFRAEQRARALPVQVGALLDLRRRIEAEPAESPLARFRRHPSYLALCDALEAYLHDVDVLFTPGGDRSSHVHGDVAAGAHRRLLTYMMYH